jgi:hypothetical protein
MNPQLVLLPREESARYRRPRLADKPRLAPRKLHLIPARHAPNKTESFADLQLPDLLSALVSRGANVDVAGYAVGRSDEILWVSANSKAEEKSDNGDQKTHR